MYVITDALKAKIETSAIFSGGLFADWVPGAAGCVVGDVADTV